MNLQTRYELATVERAAGAELAKIARFEATAA